MTRRDDRMETVLRVRRIAQQRALAEVARARTRVSEAEDRVAASSDRLDAHRPAGTDGLGLRADRDAGVALRDHVEAARTARTAALSAKASAVAAWQTARVEERAVERLVERRRAAAAAEEAVAEQARLDELALLMRREEAS